MEKKNDSIPEIRINNEKIKFIKEDLKKNTLSPMFGAVMKKKDLKEPKEKGEKSHHDFMKFSQDNKYPLGRKVENKYYTKEEVFIKYIQY